MDLNDSNMEESEPELHLTCWHCGTHFIYTARENFRTCRRCGQGGGASTPWCPTCGACPDCTFPREAIELFDMLCNEV